eukprot:TRINITY_DN16422_c0_g1_i1.p1 TRINITY_DN16422_c0_g1~~TRINITY_DN16422_c0_g1_i1.p1  ORF type:complete len:100 (+),score=25.07 TRINITY_DN16422_c0_g1_i1:647-946(+)
MKTSPVVNRTEIMILPPDLGKEFLCTELVSPPCDHFTLFQGSKYESQEKRKDEEACLIAKSKTFLLVDEQDSDEDDWVQEDGMEEGILKKVENSRCLQQ